MNGSQVFTKQYKSSRIKEQFSNSYEEQMKKHEERLEKMYYPDYDHKYKKQKSDFEKTKKAIWTEVDQLFEDSLWNS